MKTRSLRLKKGKSKKFRMKRGGQQKNMPSQSGGAPILKASLNTTLDLASVKLSLQSFGNSVTSLNNAYISGVNAATQHMVTAEADAASAVALQSATQSLYDAFFGVASPTDGTPPTVGLYHTIILGANASNGDNEAYTPDATLILTNLSTQSDADLLAAYDAAKALWTKSPPATIAGQPAPRFPDYNQWIAIANGTSTDGL